MGTIAQHVGLDRGRIPPAKLSREYVAKYDEVFRSRGLTMENYLEEARPDESFEEWRTRMIGEDLARIDFGHGTGVRE